MEFYTTNRTALDGNSSYTHEMAPGIAQGKSVGDPEDLRRGPWTAEEDRLLVDYIADHGDGRWNCLARSAGLKRSGKSCRLRWLNYLRPDVRRGNFSPEEQFLILDLQSRYGNRWSKIAQHLPGRTDNEIKNYWRTRVQRHAKQLKCDVNSQKFRDAFRCVLIPRLMERIQVASASSTAVRASAASVTLNPADVSHAYAVQTASAEVSVLNLRANTATHVTNLTTDSWSMDLTSSDSSEGTSRWPTSPSVSDVLTDNYPLQKCSTSTTTNYGSHESSSGAAQMAGSSHGGCSELFLSPCADLIQQWFPDFEQNSWQLADQGISAENFWTDDDDIWFWQQCL